jgi:hypothetical protein
MADGPAAPVPGVVLDWRRGQIGPMAPCVLCSQPALCRSPVKDVPCHKGCAESWITAHARDAADLHRLIRAHGGGWAA